MPSNIRSTVVFWVALIFAIFQLYVPVFIHLYDLQLRSIHVLLGISTVYLVIPFRKHGKAGRALLLCELLIIGIVLAANVNIFLSWLHIYTYPGESTLKDLILGGALMIIVLEASRRATGWAIPICVVIMFSYVFLGPIMPGMWVHPGFPLEHVIESVYYSPLGIYGSLTGLSATFIAMFIIFGSLLSATGGGTTFINLALLIAGRFRGGPAKVAVVSSAMFGSISGSAVANVSVTGNYTIPLMRRLGYDANFAGGVEAMASTGGGITPPIMGISAFIMAELIGIPYIKIIGYALIPCLLFYSGMLGGVHFEALRLGLAPVPKGDMPSWRSVLTWSSLGPLFIPIALLIWLLLRGFALITAGFYASILVIVFYLFADFSISGMKKRFLRTVQALSEGGQAVAKIVPILVSVNMFINLLGLTGVAPKISGLIVQLGAHYLLSALLVAAVVPLILGAPLPVSATYILSVALIAPALIRLQIDVVAAHMFLIYWATLASVTPPTCTGAVIAANLGGGYWLNVAFAGMRLGIVAFLIPFFFVLEPALLARGTAADIMIYTASALIGTIFIASGFFGYMRYPLIIPLRALYILSGILLLYPSHGASIIGLVVAAAAWFFESPFAKRMRGI
jgi:TRAP transporter 4TM/12TM fusion protein